MSAFGRLADCDLSLCPICIFWAGWRSLRCWLRLLRAREPDTLQLRAGVKLLPARPGQAFLLAYCCGILWYAGTCYWIYNTMRQYGGVGTLAALGLLFLFCLYLALYHGVFGLLISLLANPAGSDIGRARPRDPIPDPPGSSSGSVCVGRGGTGPHPHHRISLGPAGHRAGGQHSAGPHCHRDRRLRAVLRNHGGEYGAGRRVCDSRGERTAQQAQAASAGDGRGDGCAASRKIDQSASVAHRPHRSPGAGRTFRSCRAATGPRNISKARCAT